jgi:DNA ligase-associated metallophosphoesterase
MDLSFVRMNVLKIKIRDQEFVCLPEKALLWDKERTLMLSDVHLGKDSHFRKNGIVVPEVSQGDIMRIKELICKHGPKEVFILGDLFHSYMREEYAGFRHLLDGFPGVLFRYVAGNHDASALKDEQVPDNLWFGTCWEHKGFRFVHHLTEESTSAFTFQGHIHPQVQVKLKRNQSFKFPALVIQKDRAVLPAFGRFTGGHKMEIDKKSDRVIVFPGNECFEIRY